MASKCEEGSTRGQRLYNGGQRHYRRFDRAGTVLQQERRGRVVGRYCMTCTPLLDRLHCIASDGIND